MKEDTPAWSFLSRCVHELGLAGGPPGFLTAAGGRRHVITRETGLRELEFESHTAPEQP